MSSPAPIPTPPSRRSSGASGRADADSGYRLPASTTFSFDPLSVTSGPPELVVGGPPSSPSPLALRAFNSPSKRQTIRVKIPADLRLLDYVSNPDSNLVCLICHTPYDRPVRLACDHYFCAECLDHALDAQHTSSNKTCPTCRSRIDFAKEPLPAPKILETMLDELIVKCPNSKGGCTWLDQRGNVRDHVNLYCEFTQVECPAPNCRAAIAQKDYHRGCLHYTVSCEHCHTAMMRKDLEDHQRHTCQNRITDCPHCSVQILRLDLKAHVKDVCPRAVIPCPGSVIGCPFVAQRTEVEEHSKACPMATMAPHFKEQQARVERNEAKLEPLQRKVAVLEDGFSNLHNMLYPTNPSDASSFPVTNPLDPNNPEAFPPAPLMPETPDFRLPPASYPPAPPVESQNPAGNPFQPPFNSDIHHLLTLHDSLREEMSRISNALTEVEGRTNMLILNESQRSRDEMLHMNAAINSMRMQLHWLMSARLQQRAPTSAAGSPTASRGGGSSAPTAGPSTARSGGGVQLPAPVRRLSDSLRQETKL